MSDASLSNNRSALKSFLSTIATIKGDLSNITAPPFTLAPYSTCTLPQYFADRPWLFTAPAREPSPEKRALLVLKNFLASLRNQQYGGRPDSAPLKKPLNAFLGELFLGRWSSDDEDIGETRLVAEQVSHHPPITACFLWNDKSGVSAQGFTQQEITFNGNVHVAQRGYAIARIERFNEEYLIPMPSVKVKGVLTGSPYPELEGVYRIVASSGIVAEIEFQGKGLLSSGSKHGFEARIFRREKSGEILYTARGKWSGRFNFYDADRKEIDVFDTQEEQTFPIEVLPRGEQDTWESGRAWENVLDALKRGNMKGVVSAKAEVEEGQRRLRREEEETGKEWQPLFFRRFERDEVFERLVGPDCDIFRGSAETSVWKVDREAAEKTERPFRGNLLPTGKSLGGDGKTTRSNQARDDSDAKSEQNGHDTLHGQTNGGTEPQANDSANVGFNRVVAGVANGGFNRTLTGEMNGMGNDPTQIQVEEMLRAKYSSAKR